MISDVPERARRNARCNIGATERTLSVLAGAGLATAGLPLRGLPRLALWLGSLELLRRGLTGTSYLYRIVGVDRSRPDPARHVSERSATLLRPRSEVYREWRNLLRSEWGAELVEERRDELLRWRVTRPGEIRVRGQARLSDAPRGRGTELRVRLNYEYRGPRAESPDAWNRESLWRFKRLMETGEVPTAEMTREHALRAA